MKKTKSRKVIFTISIFVLILSYFLFSLYTKNRNKKLEIEKSLSYNFENFTIPEVTDFSDILTNYAKTLEKTPIYDNSNLLKEKLEIHYFLKTSLDVLKQFLLLLIGSISVLVNPQ